MASITFKVDTTELDRLIQFTNPKLFDKAIRGGIRQASATAKTQSAKGIGQSYNLTAARIKKDITVSMSPGAEYATLRFSRRPPTLTQYGAKPGTRATGQPGLGRGMGWGKPAKPGKPVSAAIFRGQRESYPGAFTIAGNGGNTIIVRKDNRGKLHSVYGASVGSIFLGSSAHAQRLQAETSIAINAAFIKGFQRVIDSAARGYGR